MKKLLQLLSLSCVLLFASCSTIFLPHKQKVAIKPGNNQSTVYVDNDEVGKGATVTATLKTGDVKQVVIQTPNYKDEYICIVPSRRPIAFYALLPLDIITCYG